MSHKKPRGDRMNSRPILPLVFLVSLAGVLIWQAGDDEQRSIHAAAITIAPAVTSPVRVARSSMVEHRSVKPTVAGSTPAAPAIDSGPWPNTEIVNQLRDVDSTAASHRAAITKALPVLATDQDVQLLVGGMLIGHGDLIDGLAWKLLACMYCTLVDERIGYGCAAEGLCDPNLAYIDVLKRDFGERRWPRHWHGWRRSRPALPSMIRRPSPSSPRSTTGASRRTWASARSAHADPGVPARGDPAADAGGV